MGSKGIGKHRTKPSRADVREANDWWASLSDEKVVSTHRWLAGLGKMPAPSQPEVLFEVDESDPPSAAPG